MTGLSPACSGSARRCSPSLPSRPSAGTNHLRPSSPIESVLATVRHRTVRTKVALSQETARLMVFKLIMAATRTWRRLKGESQLPKVIDGVTFSHGIECGMAGAKNAA